MALPDSTGVPARPGPAVDRNPRASSGAACVEITGFPQTLYLRRKIDDDPAHSLIHTVRGSGYRIDRTAPFGNQ